MSRTQVRVWRTFHRLGSSDTRGMPRILSPSAAALRREKRRVKKARQRAAIDVTEQWVRLGNLFGPGATTNAASVDARRPPIVILSLARSQLVAELLADRERLGGYEGKIVIVLNNLQQDDDRGVAYVPVVSAATARGLDVLLWRLPPTVVGLGPARVAAMRLALERLGPPILVMDDDVERWRLSIRRPTGWTGVRLTFDEVLLHLLVVHERWPAAAVIGIHRWYHDVHSIDDDDAVQLASGGRVCYNPMLVNLPAHAVPSVQSSYSEDDELCIRLWQQGHQVAMIKYIIAKTDVGKAEGGLQCDTQARLRQKEECDALLRRDDADAWHRVTSGKTGRLAGERAQMCVRPSITSTIPGLDVCREVARRMTDGSACHHASCKKNGRKSCCSGRTAYLKLVPTNGNG